MYTPKSFKEDRLDVLHQFIRSNPFGLLVSNGEDGPVATSIPFLLVENGSKVGMFQAHLARANQHWKSLDGQSVLVIFQGPNSYISPSWYPSKDEHGKVVPTWNYVMIQARGQCRVIEDQAWLKQQITSLTNQQEESRPNGWKVSDAPESYIDAEIKSIVGLEINIKLLEGKWKVSQNRNAQDRAGAAEGLLADGNTEMSDLIKKRGGLE